MGETVWERKILGNLGWGVTWEDEPKLRERGETFWICGTQETADKTEPESDNPRLRERDDAFEAGEEGREARERMHWKNKFLR